MNTQTPAPTELDLFETRLLAELRREVAASPVAVPRRRRRALATAAGVAATAVVGVVLVPGLGTTPAYSVQEGNAGEVVVEINRPEDAAGLEAALAERGITSDITYLTDLATCAPGRYTPVDREVGMALRIGEDTMQVTLAPGDVRDGETFVMVWSVDPMTDEELVAEDASENGVRTIDGFTSSVEADVTAGPVGACDVVAAPEGGAS